MGRCDSFVVETDVHYPTDINLLFDAVRKMIQIAAIISQSLGMSVWRQSEYNIRSFKKLYRQAQRLKHSTSKDENKKARRLNWSLTLIKRILNLPKNSYESQFGPLKTLIHMIRCAWPK